MGNTTYVAYPTLARFHADYLNYTYRFVAGSPGSGKSVACVMDLLAIAFRQEPAPDAVRYTRFGVVRSTYGELERTTLETLLAWLPRDCVSVTRSKPIKVRALIPLPDKTTADIQFDLIAIESAFDLTKLDSYEATAFWLNEVTGLPPATVGKAGERAGRYPPSNKWSDGQNHCTWRGVIGDYNYPSKDHWLVGYLHEGEMPPNTMLYEQPPALIEEVDPVTGATDYRINPQAENLINLDNRQKYLDDLATYKRLGEYDMIETRLLCRYGRAGGDGKGVFTNFDREYHVATEELVPAVGTPTLISIDTSGIHPCALFWQSVRGVWCITDGIYGDEMGLEEFIDDVMTPLITVRYPACRVNCVCDPANARDARTNITPIDLLRDRGYPAIPASTNKFKTRLQACELLLSNREKGRVVISPHVQMLIDALDGGYQYRKLRVVGAGVQFSGQPLKNQYSHWADAFQYGALHVTTNKKTDKTVDIAKRVAAASISLGR